MSKLSNVSSVYKGFKFDYAFGFVTFCNEDMEDGSGDWSGSASCMQEAMDMVDELIG
jgi:hypothetical protein